MMPRPSVFHANIFLAARILGCGHGEIIAWVVRQPIFLPAIQLQGVYLVQLAGRMGKFDHHTSFIEYANKKLRWFYNYNR